MLRKSPKVGKILYYVVNDFDGRGVFKVKVTQVTNGYIIAVGLEGGIKGVSLMFSFFENNIFDTSLEAERYLRG